MNRVVKVHLKWVVVIIQKGKLSQVVTLVNSQGKKRKQKKRVFFASNTILLVPTILKKSKHANLIHPIGKPFSFAFAIPSILFFTFLQFSSPTFMNLEHSR